VIYMEEISHDSARPAARGLIRYVPFDVPRDAMREIVVGPGPMQDTQAHAVHALVAPWRPFEWPRGFVHRALTRRRAL